MSKRALLIGSQTYGLTGANPDVALLAETLRDLGFVCDVRIDGDATRQGMIDAYERLIAETPEGSQEPVVVYYSGHGGRSALPDWQERQRRGQPSHLRYLVPFDMEATTESDFRGLLSEELSALQRRLTERTANVTTILDCCHSGTMSRDPSLLPKAAARAFSLEAAIPLLDALDVGTAEQLDDSNQLAVRLVACDPLQSAYERASSLGGRHGALTEALVVLIRELGDRALTWRVATDRMRRSITTTLPMQRPEVEGPADRLMFSLTTRSAAGALPATAHDGVVSIDSARLFGISLGDVYSVRTEDDAPVGTATVTSIDDDRAVLDVLADAGASASADQVAIAVPVRTTRTKPVSIEVTTASVAALLRESVETSTMLHLLRDGEAPLARIVEQTGLVVLDAEGFMVQTAFPLDEGGALSAVTLVERVAKAERVRALASGGDGAAVGADLAVEFVTHDEQGTHVRGRTGERLYVGERISVSLTNSGNVDLYVGLLDIDTAYQVIPLNSDEPSGWRLQPGATKVVGTEKGVALKWDDGVPKDGERPETLLVIASTEPVDLRPLATPRGERGAESTTELGALLQEASTGQRGFPAGAASNSSAGYLATAIDFYLVPSPKPATEEPEFAIDELPDVSLRTTQPRALVTPPTRVAVRLVTLKVLQNRALFKAAVRLDALVITGSGDQVVATPFTYRFPSIADGDLLPADNLQLFLGPVNDFLDIAVWLNRDDSKGKDLTELFEQKVKSADLKEALTVAGGLVLAAPQVAVAVGGVVAVATIVRVSAELVNAAVGKEIGLYRTSFLPFEKLGLGRHPADGLRRAQGIEFAFEVVDPG
jgi:hypothetical protein